MSGVHPEGSRGSWDLEEIRRRADLVELISPHVRLRKAGRRLTGLCPFHQERTPSFSVDPETGLWYCFGCKVGGDVFRFVEMVEKVSFQDAVELLARRLGIQPRTPVAASQARAKERLLDLHERAALFFNTALKSRSGSAARAYLKDRGVSEGSVESFLLGYAPDQWDALLNAMDKHGFPGKDLARAGLVVQRDDGGHYDRFRNRLVFPVRDATGRIIAFGGRALAADQQPKYLNSPETPLFQKNQTLYAFDTARRAMSDKGRAIVVEGYMDVIACHEAGFAETVATMGTALTPGHVNLLRRRTDKLVLAFDSDSAGLAAALRSSELFRQAEVEVRVLTLPEGMDPDSLIRSKGPAAFAELVDAAPPMLEWQLGRLLARAARSNGRARAEAVDAAVTLVAELPPGAVRDYSKHWLGERVRAIAASAEPQSHQRRLQLERELVEALDSGIKRRDRKASGTRVSPGETGRDVLSRPPGSGPDRLRTSLLATFLQHGDLAGRFVPLLEREDFQREEQKQVFDAIAQLVEEGGSVGAEAILVRLGADARELLAQLSLEEVVSEQAERSLETGVRRLVEARLRRQQRILQQRLTQPMTEKEQEATLRELTELDRRRSELAGQRIVGDR